MDVTMKRNLKTLVVCAVILFSVGAFSYLRGAEINDREQDAFLWEQAPGDKWLYAGGLMILFGGSLSLAALRIWMGRKRNV